MGYLILVRHGESRWNTANKFTGWVDVPLSEIGVHEALIAAAQLEGIELGVAFTSQLVRAQETLLLILSHQDATGIFKHEQRRKLAKWSAHQHSKVGYELPVYISAELNERYYGKLQGMNKDDARKKYGKDQVFAWRRSYATRPPGGESLKDVYKRSVKYFEDVVMAEVKKGKHVIIAAHGNSLRAIIKHIENISDDKIPFLELPLGKPIVYEYSSGHLHRDQKHQFKRPIHWQHQPVKLSSSKK